MKISQTEQIKKVLLEEGRITSWEAIQRFRITRLSACIWNLRSDGMDIKSTSKHDKTTGKHWAEYTYETVPILQENKNRIPSSSQVP